MSFVLQLFIMMVSAIFSIVDQVELIENSLIGLCEKYISRIVSIGHSVKKLHQSYQDQQIDVPSILTFNCYNVNWDQEVGATLRNILRVIKEIQLIIDSIMMFFQEKIIEHFGSSGAAYYVINHWTMDGKRDHSVIVTLSELEGVTLELKAIEPAAWQLLDWCRDTKMDLWSLLDPFQLLPKLKSQNFAGQIRMKFLQEFERIEKILECNTYQHDEDVNEIFLFTETAYSLVKEELIKMLL